MSLLGLILPLIRFLDVLKRQKSEDNLAVTESELDKHTNLVTGLTKKIDELQVKADEAHRLKDQVDEYAIFSFEMLIND